MTHTTSPPPRPDTAADGDRAANDLLAAFNDVRFRLVSTLTHILRSYTDAQDVAQETFLKCWRARDRAPEFRHLPAWIFRVGLNAAKDWQRRAWNRRAHPLTDADVIHSSPSALPLQAVQELEMRDRLHAALQQLRPDEQEVFFLRENSNLTFDEIAHLRGCPVGTIKTQMRSAIRKLREVLHET